ncbi:MAG: hypothetical protein ABIS29_11945 [Vicinamibacterales bacterium]
MSVFVSCALLLHKGPAIAQSNSTFEHPRVSLTSVHQYVAAEAVPRQLALPSNLRVSSTYRPLVESMLRDSPTFRRQCMRIGADPGLTVRLSIGETLPSAGARATTRITQSAKGQRSAVVEIGSRQDTEELIAHELEHIIEQLDGVDLAARAARPHTGVTTVGYTPDMFETVRAKRTGLKVASELGR